MYYMFLLHVVCCGISFVWLHGYVGCNKYVVILTNQASRYAIQHIWCLSQARINWEGCGRKGIRRKIGEGDDGGGGIDGPDGVASSWIVGERASIIFPTPHKIQNDDRLP